MKKILIALLFSPALLIQAQDHVVTLEFLPLNVCLQPAHHNAENCNRGPSTAAYAHGDATGYSEHPDRYAHLRPAILNEAQAPGTLPPGPDLPMVQTLRGTYYTAEHFRYTVRP
jgi:hypothetical protein